MPRKGPAPRRELVADPIYKSVLVTQLINKVMLHGKRTVAEFVENFDHPHRDAEVNPVMRPEKLVKGW